MSSIFGIDLGTTFSGIAQLDDQDQLHIIPNAEGNRFTPSAVYFAPNGSVTVGRKALQMAPMMPHRVVTSAKRRMGDPEWLWEFDHRFFRPADIGSIILKQLKRNAENATGETVCDVVMSVPAHFHEPQRAATIEAASMAGLNVVRLINEPTAAALAFGMEQLPLPDNGWLLVVDLGGGTLDVTLLEALDGHLHIRATQGHAELGGEDWDALLLHHAATHFVSQYGIDPLDDPMTYQHLRDQCIAAKHTLSTHPETELLLAYEGHQLHYSLTEETFRSMSHQLLGQLEDLCTLVLRDQSVAWQDLAHLILVGGASSMPMVKERLLQFIDTPILSLFRADEAVLYGTALQAAALSSTLPARTQGIKQLDGASNVTSLRDINSHTLGLVILDRQKRPTVDAIIPKHSPLPHTHHETYYTAHDQQSSLRLQIVEGESTVVEECVLLGEAEISGLPPRAAGQRIDIQFTYDESGILTISVEDLGAGTQHNITLQRSQQRSLREIQMMKRLILNQP